MQAIERVSPVVSNGIEFYVSASGTESGLSVTAVAKLAGIPHQYVSRAIAQETTPKWLESLQGELFHSHITNAANGRATIVTTKAASRIIRYYAYEAKQTNQTARDNFNKFSEVGMHTWILHTTGYTATVSQQPVNPVSSIAGLEAMLELAKSHIQQLKNMEDKPGLASIMKDYANTDYNQLPPASICLRDYLAGKDITLNKSDMGYVSGVVAATYKAHRGTLPNQISVNYLTSTGKRANAMVHGYQVDDYALIDAALELLRII